MNRLPSAFRRVWIGSTLGQLGDVGFMLALPWLVLQMTGSSLALGSVMMALAIPRALLMLVGGAVSDRYAARRILAIACTVQAMCAVAIAALLHVAAMDLSLLYGLAFCFGVADAFSEPALRVVVPELVAAEQLPRANALLQASGQLCLLAGSAVGGVAIAQWGVLPVFVFHAASYGGLIAILLCLPTPARAAAPAGEDGLWAAIANGLRHVWHARALRSLLTSFAGINFCMAGATQIGLVVLANAHYGSAGLGVLMTCVAAGSLTGMITAGKWQPAAGTHAGVAGASIALAVLLAGLALPMPLWWVCLIAALLGAVAGFVNVVVISWLQGQVRGDMLGRVMSVLGLASAGIVPLSLVAAGLVARHGTDVLFMSASGLLILMLVAFRRG
ncbi:MFS transporter [Duganella sp. Leaf61]|uniref:MFS transporter n=1 Tax=Duganella sp. Leaf61 TaxID=1736227 RepID=UPI0006F3E42B|nr:MFS transporter [Duganella sp. Leaf61]